jgi:hypothetical protein
MSRSRVDVPQREKHHARGEPTHDRMHDGGNAAALYTINQVQSIQKAASVPGAAHVH